MSAIKNIGKKSLTFTPQKDIPSLEGKVILITGGNIGLGKQCVLEYAKHKPAQVWLAARNLDKAKAAIEEIQKQLTEPATIKLLQIDLSSLESVQKAAATFSAESDRLDILMLNAGIMAAPPGLTKDGYEIQFGTNYVGHALLAKLLLPVLEKTVSYPGADVRVVMVSSTGHTFAPKPDGIVFDSLKTKGETLGAYNRYGQSKLAMILWAREVAKVYPKLTVAAIHPGVVETNLTTGATGSGVFMKLLLNIMVKIMVVPVDQGAKNQLWASVGKNVKSGEYYEPVGKAHTVGPLGKSDELAKKLWDWTEKELEGYSA